VEKIIRIVLVVIVCLLLAALGVFAIKYTRDMGQLRSALRASEERADLATAKADASRAILDSIDGRISTAQSAIASAIDSGAKLRAILDAIQAISIELRKRPIESLAP